MGCLVILFAVVLDALISGCVVYALWNWIAIGVIGFALPTLSFAVCCIAGYLISVLFN